VRAVRRRGRRVGGGWLRGLSGVGVLVIVLVTVASVVAVSALTANLNAPDSNAGQEVMTGCDAGLKVIGGDSVFDASIGGVTYRVHEFTAAGARTVEVCAPVVIEYLVVGGGGSGGSGGGGGDGGEVATNLGAAVLRAAGTYTVTVGSGGVAGGSEIARQGGDSGFAEVTAHGGAAAVPAATGAGAGGAGAASDISGVSASYGAGGAVGGSSPTPLDGVANTGQGGQGARSGHTRPTGSGGSGIVIIRYQL